MSVSAVKDVYVNIHVDKVALGTSTVKHPEIAKTLSLKQNTANDKQFAIIIIIIMHSIKEHARTLTHTPRRHTEALCL